MGDDIGVLAGPTETAVTVDDLTAAAAALEQVASELALPRPRAPWSTDRHALALLALAEAHAEGARTRWLLLQPELRLLAGSVRAVARSYAAAERASALAIEAARDLGVGLAAGATLTAAPVIALAALHSPVRPEPEAVVRSLDALAWRMPWLVDTVMGGAEGLVTPGVGVSAQPVGLGVMWALAVACASEGRPYPPRDAAEAAGVLLAVGRLLGVLHETGAAPVVTEASSPSGRPAPGSLADLAADDIDVEGRPGQVRVVEVDGPEGARWVVEVPGTQSASLIAGRDVFDPTSDVRLMAAEASAVAAAVAGALARAQAATGRSPEQLRAEPVLLSGHSQGGIVAAALASDPDFRARHRVSDVVALGAPVGAFPMTGVRVLSVEHTQDLVPRLDGAGPVRREGMTTVTRDLTGTGTAALASAAHDGRRYVETARIAERDPRLARWRRDTAAFFRGERVVVREYVVERGWQNPRP